LSKLPSSSRHIITTHSNNNNGGEKPFWERRISVQTALKEAIKADTLSLVMFENGLFGWMALVALVLIGNLYPISPVFWFMMQISCKLVVG